MGTITSQLSESLMSGEQSYPGLCSKCVCPFFLLSGLNCQQWKSHYVMHYSFPGIAIVKLGVEINWEQTFSLSAVTSQLSTLIIYLPVEVSAGITPGLGGGGRGGPLGGDDAEAIWLEGGGGGR